MKNKLLDRQCAILERIFTFANVANIEGCILLDVHSDPLLGTLRIDMHVPTESGHVTDFTVVCNLSSDARTIPLSNEILIDALLDMENAYQSAFALVNGHTVPFGDTITNSDIGRSGVYYKDERGQIEIKSISGRNTVMILRDDKVMNVTLDTLFKIKE